MSSRRRNSKKNLGNSISDIQRRIRRMERKPIRTRLQNRVIKGSAIAPNTITAEEVDFGTAVVTSDTPADVVDNPKDGLLIINPDTNSASVYSETQGDYVDIQDSTARASADGKNTIYRSTTQPTGGTYVTGDTWFDEDDNNKIYRYNGTSFVALQLGGNALANISANSVNTGTLNANLITVSNLDVGTMTTGNLSATRISAGTISASISITAPTITSGGLTINANGSITTSTGNFGLSTTGVVTATGVDITGEINATSGTFTGYVTAGNARFGVNVDSTYDGIWLAANNYWYDTGDFKVGDGTESMTYTSAGGLVVTGEISAGTFSGNITATGTISGGTISGATVTGGSISTNAVTSFSTVSTSDPRVTIAPYTLSFESSGVGIALDSGAGSAPGGINISANLAGTSSNLSIQGQSHGSGTGRGVIVLNSGATGSAGYAAIGVSGGTNNNSILITNTYASLSVGSTATTYALRNIKCVTSFTQASDTTGTDGDVVLVYT